MNIDSEYLDIRPYRDHEFRTVMDQLLDSSLSDLLISTVFPGYPVDQVKQQLRSINTIKDFQEKIIYQVMQMIINKTSTGLTRSGLENLETGRNYLFISNHRDIILDPSLINTVIVEQGFETAEVAIGDNLLDKPWVKDLARLNKSFIVKRNLSVRELIIASKRLSEYIRETVLVQKKSVWIAQREGRAKDGNDRTQAGVLNMIGLTATGSLKQYFMDLNIIPVSLSYEKDPCDEDKARSLYAQKHFGGYTKKENEDNLAMRKGIMGNKGHIHIHFGVPLSEQIAQLPDDLHKNELIQQVGLMIDRQVVGNYRLHKSNYIAYDQLRGTTCGMGKAYSEEDKTQFFSELDDKIANMDGDAHELRSIFIEMYARPHLNKLALEKEVNAK
jgi:hypothetical protein